MCNNIRANILNKPKKEEVVKDKISDWIESRETPEIVKSNKVAKSKRTATASKITYKSKFPLKLHDKTRIHEITMTPIDEKFCEVAFKFCFHKETKPKTCYIKRYLGDDINELERFLENSQSIFQTRNIDLNFK